MPMQMVGHSWLPIIGNTTRDEEWQSGTDAAVVKPHANWQFASGEIEG